MNGEKILFKCVHGSHLYGLSTPNSDIDYKGVFLPNLEDLVLGRAPNHYRSSTGPEHGKNSTGDVDEVYFSLPKFMEMLAAGDTVAVDMLHAPSAQQCVLQSSPEFDFLYENRQRFYTSEMKAFMGYCTKQAAKYGLKGSKIAALEEILRIVRMYDPREGETLGKYVNLLPRNEHCRVETAYEKKPNGKEIEFYNVLGSKYQTTISLDEFKTLIEKKLSVFGDRAHQAKNNENVDWKAVSHAIRAAYQLQEIYLDNDLRYPFKGDKRELLLEVKNGQRDFKREVQPTLEALISRVRFLADASDLPKKVDRKFCDDFVLAVYGWNENIDSFGVESRELEQKIYADY